MGLAEEPRQFGPNGLLAEELPRERLSQLGPRALSTTELLAIVIGTGHGDDNVLQLAHLLLHHQNGLTGLYRSSVTELQGMRGIGLAKATRIKASLELGRRLMSVTIDEKPKIVSPADAANILMPEMMYLEQEHLRLVLMDTRNHLISTPTIYIGSLNTSVIRIGELFKTAIKENAAAMIVAQNHPSGDASPSPEDVHVTRKIVEAGQLLSIEVLDHIIIGHQNFVSLKEKGLGFS